MGNEIRNVGDSSTSKNPHATLRVVNAELKAAGFYQGLRLCFQKWPLAAAFRIDWRRARLAAGNGVGSFHYSAGEKRRGLSSRLIVGMAGEGLI